MNYNENKYPCCHTREYFYISFPLKILNKFCIFQIGFLKHMGKKNSNKFLIKQSYVQVQYLEIMRILNVIVATLMFIAFTNVKAEMQYGVGLLAGQTTVDGTETEGSAADTSNRSKSIEEFFVGGDIFAEYISGDGMTYGISLVPFNIEIGDGSRTDTNSGADIASEADTGTRKASAEISNLITLYTNIPMGTNGWYGLLGYHHTTVETDETLNDQHTEM